MLCTADPGIILSLPADATPGGSALDALDATQMRAASWQSLRIVRVRVIVRVRDSIVRP